MTLGLVCWPSGCNDGLCDIPELSNPTQFELGWMHTCAIDDTGLVCWGSDYLRSDEVPVLKNPIQISLASYHDCALDNSGVHCWNGQNNDLKNIPVLINPAQISAGNITHCALTDLGVVCWGGNQYGGLDVPDLMIDPDGDGHSNQNGLDAFPFDAD